LKILDRYILKEITTTFLLGIGAFTLVLLMDKVIRLTDLILNKGVGFDVAFRLFLYLIPSFLTLTIPLATLLATLTTFGRMASDREVTALKTSGVSLYRLLLTPMAFASLAFALNLYLTIHLTPRSFHSFKSLLFQIARSQANIGLREGVFNTDFGNFVVYVRNLRKEGRVLEGVLLSDSQEKKTFKVVIAKRGELVENEQENKVILRLSEGSVHFTFPRDPSLYRELSFDRYDLELDLGRLSGNPLERKKEDREMTFRELVEKIRQPREARIHPHYVTEFHKKFSIPFASLVFVLSAIPLGVRVRRSGRFSGFSLSVTLALGYYLLFVLGESLGDKGLISPFIAVWFPNILLGVLGMILLHLEAKEKWSGWSWWPLLR